NIYILSLHDALPILKIYKYKDILEQANELGCKKHLLLGNGFSIAWNKDIFNYESLYNSIDFSKKKRLKKVFDQLKTTDFEYVLRDRKSTRLNSSHVK